MVKAERIIRFPMPSDSGLINPLFNEAVYCVCYQHDFDSNGYGLYGFDTETSQLIIRNTFRDVYICQKDSKGDFSSISKESNTHKKSLYLYGNSELISSMDNELKKYNLSIARNNIKIRHLLPPENLPKKPLLLEVFKGGIYQYEVLKKLIESNCGVFIRHSYTPEAGEVFIIFNESTWSELKINARHCKVDFLETPSINNLRPW